MDRRAFVSRYDALIAAPRMRKLYGASGYFNVGYWADGATDLVAACDRLVDEVATVVSRDAAVIIDVGCGLGASTCRLAEQFPHALVIGANISPQQLITARCRGVEALVVMDAASIAIADGAADAVLAIESAQHFDTRTAFLTEAHRVLRPDGVLAVADMLFKDADVFGSWMIPDGKRVTTTSQYAKMLGDVGFIDVTVRDITGVSWLPFCSLMRGVFEGHEDALRAIKESLTHYVIAYARRASHRS